MSSEAEEAYRRGYRDGYKDGVKASQFEAGPLGPIGPSILPQPIWSALVNAALKPKSKESTDGRTDESV